MYAEWWINKEKNIFFHEISLQLFLGWTNVASRSIYRKANSINDKIVHFAHAYLWGVLTIIYIMPATYWASTLLFGVPSIDRWYLPLPLYKV